MKKKLFALVLFILCLGCTDENNEEYSQQTSKFAYQPEAKSEHNNSYKGIYKGSILNGSSGFIYVNILNEGEILAKTTLNSQTRTFQLVNEQIIENESGELRRYTFENEGSSFIFEIRSDGSLPAIKNAIIDGRKSNGYNLQKELSTAIVKCYFGYFSGNDNGMLVFTTREDGKLLGLCQPQLSENTTQISGTLTKITMNNNDGFGNDLPPIDTKITTGQNGNILPITIYQITSTMHMGSLKGELNGYSIAGNWYYENSNLGKWKVDRIM